jgi:hypothetical protein
MNRYESATGRAAGLQRMSMLWLQRFLRSSMWLPPIGCLIARRGPGNGLPARPAKPDRDAVRRPDDPVLVRQRAGVADDPRPDGHPGRGPAGDGPVLAPHRGGAARRPVEPAGDRVVRRELPGRGADPPRDPRLRHRHGARTVDAPVLRPDARQPRLARLVRAPRRPGPAGRWADRPRRRPQPRVHRP